MALLVTLVTLTGCRVGYLAEAGWYQAEMLAAREPIDEVLDRGGLSAGQEQRLRRVPQIKAFGATLGLAATENYDALAVGWDRTIWNVSASAPLSFEPVTWWFPIVGRVPYLGFFVEADAREQARRLADAGNDVHVRTAGAYSTLGWFRDPVLPGMLRWSETQLAETVFHELAHATLWVPGSVPFNETFASFVGEASTEAWLDATYGPASPERAAWDRERRDEARFEALVQTLYKDLDTLYRSDATPAAKQGAKAALYASLPTRVAESAIEDRARWIAWVERGAWNNARLAQFKAYNHDRAAFEAAWAASGGSVSGFIAHVRERTRGASDPWAAMRAVP
jgi:predicted aminopeptidase